jgi:hypothetical protein
MDMSDYPTRSLFPDPLVHLNTFSQASLGSIITKAGGLASTAWPTGSLAIFVPFRITKKTQYNTLFLMNGTVVSGNVDMGIYTQDGIKLTSAGSTAQSGTSAIQSFSVTQVELDSGLYYLALAFDNTTSTVFAQSPTIAPFLQVMGMAQMASAFALPSTVTFASVANTLIPLIGATNRSFI